MFIQGPERNYYPFIPHIAQNTYYTEPAFVPYPAIPFPVASFPPSQVSQQQQPHRVADTSVPRVKTPPRREASPMSAPPGDIGNPTECSVCLVKHPRSLAVLLPCRHPLCSACLTSALNIVGEKDMECAICKHAVNDFRLVSMESKSIGEDASRNCASSNSSKGSTSGSGRTPRNISNSEVDGSTLSPVDFGLSLDSSSEQGDPFNRASTPKEEQPKLNGLDQPSAAMSARGRSAEQAAQVDNVVLRIDNVPWVSCQMLFSPSLLSFSPRILLRLKSGTGFSSRWNVFTFYLMPKAKLLAMPMSKSKSRPLPGLFSVAKRRSALRVTGFDLIKRNVAAC